MLKNPDFIEKIAENINKTRSAKDTEPSTFNQPKSQMTGVTDKDLENIVCTTEQDPFFEALLSDIINEHFMNPQQDSEGASSSLEKKPAPEPDSVELPIKQRLRQRSERKVPNTRRNNKVKIISDVPYSGVVPAIASMSTVPNSVLPPVQTTELSQVLIVSSGMQLVPVLQRVPVTSSDIIIESQATCVSTMVPEYTQTDAPLDEVLENENTEAEKKETTPKTVLYPSYLNSRCKSTPRNKATHVRILDFNQTPTNRRLSTVKEFSTPASGIPVVTPGSAPAAMVTSARLNDENKGITPVVDDNSNSNSISNTPKVIKKFRRRKLTETKPTKKSVKKEKEKQKAKQEALQCLVNSITTVEDWKNYRSQSNLPIDQQQRLINAEAADKVPKRRNSSQKRSTTKERAAKRKSLSKSPAELKEKLKAKKKERMQKGNSSSVADFDENKPLSLMKFKIASPSKVAAMKKTSKKKKSILERSKEKFLTLETQEKSVKAKDNVEPEPKETIELNRSDTIQEVADMLTNLSETILASNGSVKPAEEPVPEKANENVMTEVTDRTAETGSKEQVDSGIEPSTLLETPLKDAETPFKNDSLTPLPNTPRFAIPLVLSSQETPMPKICAAASTTLSLLKNCDILTPSFPITPGFKETPLKDVAEGSPASASGYSSRRTDYSSCSSYYKPDESEEINQNLNAFINQRRSERTSQSESESGGGQLEIAMTLLGSAKKVECPGAIERVKSFTEDLKELPTPHYTMMNDGIDEALLSESFVTTATEDSSSSSDFTCSTCSTDSSDGENTMELLNRAAKNDEKDSDFDVNEATKDPIISPAVINEKTGEVRFPLRNWMTPKKVTIDHDQAKIDETNKIKALLNTNDPRRGLSIQEEQERLRKEMEIVKQRTLDILQSKSKAEPKFKKTNVKCFKVASEEVTKPSVASRKDQILQQQLTTRPRPTPLMLIPGSGSRRKSATPRKTIVINELPSPQKKKKKIKTPSKSEHVAMTSVSDNAVMPDLSLGALGLDMSSSFDTTNEEEGEETACTVIANETASKPVVIEEGSNTFQQALIKQGFDKSEAIELQSKLVDNLEVVEMNVEPEILAVEKLPQVVVSIEVLPEEIVSKTSETNAGVDQGELEKSESGSESDEEEDDVEFEICPAEVQDKNVFHFVEPENLKPKESTKGTAKILPLIFRLDGRKTELKDSGINELFSMEPILAKSKKSPKKSSQDSKRNCKESPKNGREKQTKKSSNQSKAREAKESEK